VIKLNQTCQAATCLLIATHCLHNAQITIVIVEPRYHPNTIAKAISGSKIHVDKTAKAIIKVRLPDWINKVKSNPIHHPIHGHIQLNAEKSISVRKFNQSFIKENAKNINPKPKRNLLTTTTLSQRVKKFIPIAPKKISGKAITATFKLKPTIQSKDVGIIVPILAHKTIDKAELNDKIPVHTNAKTRTETILELCKIDVIKIPLPKAFVLEDVYFFKKFLNHPLENDETTCPK